MNTSLASHHENRTEAGGSYLGLGSEWAPPSRQPLELMELEKDGENGTDLADGLMDIVNQYASANPRRIIFKFSADRVDEILDEKSTTLILTLSCNNPTSNLNSLTQAITHGFGHELEAVTISLVGSKVNMWYYDQFLFAAEVSAAERYIKYAAHVARGQWLKVLQRQLRKRFEPSKTQKEAYVGNLLTHGKLGVELPADIAVAERIKKAFYYVGEFCQSFKVVNLSDQTLSSDWGKKLTRELMHSWLEGSIRKGWCGKSKPFKVAFKCSNSSTEDMTIEQKAGKRLPTLTVYYSILKDYICSQLRAHTSPNGQEPAVVIRMTDKRDDTFLIGPSRPGTCVIQLTGKAEGYWISISDVDGPGPRRIILCRSSNFYTAFSHFLGATGIGRITNLAGNKQCHDGTLDFSRRDIRPADACVAGSRKRKASAPRRVRVGCS